MSPYVLISVVVQKLDCFNNIFIVSMLWLKKKIAIRFYYYDSC